MNDNKGRGLLRFIARVLVLLFVQVVALAISVASGLALWWFWRRSSPAKS